MNLNRRIPSDDPVRDLLLTLVYARVPEYCQSPAWLALAYRDYARMESVMVLPPFHHAVQFAHWLRWQWDRYRFRDSWIDRHTKATIDRVRAADSLYRTIRNPTINNKQEIKTCDS